MKNVLFIWDVPTYLREYLAEKLDLNKLNLIYADKTDYPKLAVNADAIVGWQPTEELLLHAKNLQLFINPGAGVQHLTKLKEQLKSCIVVNGHGNAFFTAEHIVAMLLNLTNKLQVHHQWMLDGRWRVGDKEAPSISLRNRKVGLLGYGHINKQVQRFLEPFACDFAVLRRNPSAGEYSPQELPKFLKEIDVLISTVPLTPETENWIGEKELALLGGNALVVNAGRGKTFNEEALFNALKNKTIHSAAIDVWYEYKPEPDKDGKQFPFSFPFNTLDNVLLSPHRAASPFSDLDRWGDDFLENLSRLGAGRKDFLNVVDLDLGY